MNSAGSRTGFREELFGPVASVYKVNSEEQAIELANDTPLGLGSYVFMTDGEQGRRVADRIEAGRVFVNTVGAEGAELPFGGRPHTVDDRGGLQPRQSVCGDAIRYDTKPGLIAAVTGTST